jgi:hypothetical protein
MWIVGRDTMPKYKYWSTEKLQQLLEELDWRIEHTSYGVSDIQFRNDIEDILHESEEVA